MLIDIYGSRSNLISTTKVRDNLNLVISNIFIGTSIESQMQKEVRIDEEKLENITSPYELLELNTDFSKRLRTQNSFPKSNIILLDFLHEGRLSIKFKSGILVDRAVNRRYGYSQGNGTILSIDQKVKNIEKYVDELENYLSDYDLIIINQLRNPKVIKNENGDKVLLENIEDINFMNYYAETFEDFLIKKLDNIALIPPYKQSEELYQGYMNEEEYLGYFENQMKEVIKDHL